jgi:hypothetical protein
VEEAQNIVNELEKEKEKYMPASEDIQDMLAKITAADQIGDVVNVITDFRNWCNRRPDADEANSVSYH